MIELTKLNRETVVVNALWVEKIESTPDTLITLVTGRKIHVLESKMEVQHKITYFYQQIHIREDIKEGLLPMMKEERKDE